MRATRLITERLLADRLTHLMARPQPVRASYGNDTSWVATTVGRVRTGNQDRAAICSVVRNRPDEQYTIAVLCDGMGGLPRGDDAAQTAMGAFLASVVGNPGIPIGRRLWAACKSANEAVFDLLSGRGGTTLVAAIVSSRGVFYANVGDSRLYGITPRRESVQLSKDDTIAGILGAGDAPDRRRNQLLQFVGMGDGLEPHVDHMSPGRFETLLLTSDGVHNSPPAAFAAAVAANTHNGELARRLISLSEVVGGLDNATAVILPSIPAADQSSPTLDVELRLITATGQSDIWISGQPVSPKRMLDERNGVTEQGPPAEPQPRGVSSDEGPANATGPVPPKKSKASRRRSRRKDRQDPALPLENESPRVEISFPNED